MKYIDTTNTNLKFLRQILWTNICIICFAAHPGITLYELHAPLMVLATRASETRSINKKDLQHQMKRVAQCLEQAAEILQLDPEGSLERQMADAAAQALLQVNEWRKQIASRK